MSRTLLPCNLTWVNRLRQFRRRLCVATVSSLSRAQLQVREADATETWRCEAYWERRRQKRAATRNAYRVAINQWRMAARRALEWIGTTNAQLDFRYEYQTCFFLQGTIFVVPYIHVHYETHLELKYLKVSVQTLIWVCYGSKMQ